MIKTVEIPQSIIDRQLSIPATITATCKFYQKSEIKISAKSQRSAFGFNLFGRLNLHPNETDNSVTVGFITAYGHDYEMVNIDMSLIAKALVEGTTLTARHAEHQRII